MTEKPLPSILGDFDDEELTQRVIDHAKYFTVVQVSPGMFRKGGSNYERTEEPTLEKAREQAKELYDKHKKRIIIYAVADFSGARNFSRPVETYPPAVKTSRELEKEAKRRKQLQRQKSRVAKEQGFADVGLNKPQPPASPPSVPATQAKFDIDDTTKPMARIIRS